MAAVAALNTYTYYYVIRHTRFIGHDLYVGTSTEEGFLIIIDSRQRELVRSLVTRAGSGVGPDRVRPLARISTRAHYHTEDYDGVITIYYRIIIRMSANRLVGYITII